MWYFHLYECFRSLLEGIKYYAGEPKMLGRALLRMEREFDKHVAYCRDEPRAQHLLKNDPVVSKYFKVRLPFSPESTCNAI